MMKHTIKLVNQAPLPSTWNRLALPLAFSSDQFNWEGNVGISWMSSLDGAGKRQVFYHIFNDFPDQGFFVKSTKTGELMPFRYEEAIFKNGEREGWVMRSCTNPQISITIFNE